ncbi:hypothetical protein FRB94_011299 [Tulasnella sp. JGI-2019a]|nr:hypothetical protein FRB94_011299 [Tulasnella sp. JGI-2019a]KAG9029097.1 hypothetical protein FRB95_005746 [Tulasnella sp. JGI-2019a]
MLSVFNIVRLTVYLAVIAFSIVVLGLAAFFDHIIIDGNLTRFIPLAIFVAACTLLILPTLLLAGLLKRVLFIVQVRSELTCAGFLGLLWFVLGLFTAIEPKTVMTCEYEAGDFFSLAQDGSASGSDTYSNDMFQLQYNVLKSFAILNALLLIAYFLLLLVLALSQHRLGRRHVWTSGVTSFSFFGPQSAAGSSLGADTSEETLTNKYRRFLPSPVTAKAAPKPSPKPLTQAPRVEQVGSPQMKAGGHYIMYIPPPPQPRRKGSGR